MPRLKTGLWVQAQVRLCDIKAVPIAIRHRGDPDAGSVLLKLVRGRDRCVLLRRISTMEGGLGWMAVLGADEIGDEPAEGYIARELGRDRDLWVVEIEDAARRYELDGPIVRD